ncbi:MAG: enoyl-CoA hydratase/isomerase family protein [Alphaproteobacteria bacterium]|nr:enoyl-CoA hydratase/isomerase family protein [Alphaproteobacteria bacterium]
MQADTLVTSARDGDIAVVTVANPPVNALSQPVRAGLQRAVAAAVADPAVGAIVLRCDGRTFIAGADITEFDKPPMAPVLSDVLMEIEAAAKPVVAAIHGTALGGGLETALASHWRVALAGARFGLPEVKLGIIPGAGGTQRLPRAVGVEKALQMITTGDMIDAREALALGLIDAIVEGDLAAAAVAFARRVVAEGGKRPRLSERDERVADARGRSELFAEARRQATRRARGQDAPLRAIEAVEAGVNESFAAGLARERAISAVLKASDQSRAQRHLFFAEREAGKIPGLGPVARPVDVASAAVIGAGTMGGGIAMCFANAGVPVTLIDAAPESLQRGLAVVRRNYESTAARGGMTAAEVERRMALIRPGAGIADVAGADVVIEAVFENTAIKRAVFAEIDRHAKAGAVLGTNTSTLDIDAIAAATGRPDSVIGLHFFSPANVMRLLEVVRGAKTADATIARAMALGRQIRKVPVLAGNCDGFIGNRMLRARGREAERLILEGALPHEVDRVLYEFGLPMGPYAMGDLAGLDIGWRIRQERGLTSPVADRLCALGRFGQKTGAGWYRYEAGSRTPVPDPAVEAIVVEVSRELGIARRSIGAEEILRRLLYPMVDEGARILEEGIAIRPGDIDVVWAYGYGWPVYRGGPMHWADSVGLARIRDGLLAMRREGDPAPAALLERLAAEGRGFRDLAAA